MSLRSANLNLVPILHALLKTQSVTRAAAMLNLSQPATSNALGRLRELLGDPLLVAVGREMRPTPRALALLPQLDAVCDGLDALLTRPVFDPASAQRCFIVGAPDYIALLASAALLPGLQAAAPGITVRFVGVRPGFAERLLDGRYDMAVIAPESEFVQRLRVSERGFPDRMVAVVRRGHPLAAARAGGRARAPRLAQLRAWPELRGHPDSDTPQAAHPPGWVPQAGVAQLVAEQFTVLPLLVAQSDAVAYVPAALARYFAPRLPIAQLEVPGDHRFHAAVVWSPTQDADPGHRWFRGVLEDALARCLAPGEA